MGKILITGTGRCGSSFLVHLLSALEMDTGYTEEQCFNELQNQCRGGLEHTIDKTYQILKNPEFAVRMEVILEHYDIDHVIIPIRDLTHTAQSRANNNANHGGYGGYWLGAQSVEEQATAHARLMYRLIEVLTRHDIPYTTIAFPRMVEDKGYLKTKLESVFKNVSYTRKLNYFSKCFDRVADIDKITVS